MLKKPLRFLLACLLAASALLTAACSLLQDGGTSSKGALVINEVVSSNKRCLIDAAIGTPDWIELYNGTDHDINLQGYGLSDNVRKLYKFTFPDVTIRAGEYLVVYAAENNGVEKTDVLCTGFGVSKSGDSLYLCDGYFEVVQEMNIPALLTDASWARRSDGTYGYCGSPTPGEANTTEIVNDISLLYVEADLTSLRITEVQPDGNGETWMELYNASDTDVRLDNYYVSDSATNLLRFQLPESTLKAGEYVVVYLTGKTGGDRIEASFKLGSADTHAYLTNWQGVLVSEIAWEPNVPAGLTVVQGEDGVARYTAFPTPGAANSDQVFDSPVVTEMDASDPVRISEALRNNKYSVIDADGDRNEWVELYNASAAPVRLSGYYLSDNPDNLFKWALPDIELPAGGYLVVFLSGKNRTEGELHASFGLSSDEDAVYLTRLDGLRMDCLPIPVDISANVSVGREKDGTLRYYAQPTPGYENAYGYESADAIGFFNKDGVYISEVSAVSAVKSNQNDWIELHNGSQTTVDLTGWYLSDDDDEPLKYRIQGVVIEPGGYAVIEATSHVTRQGAGVAAFGLSPSGETLVLSDPNGLRVDTFETGALSEGVTSGRVEGDATIARVFFTTATRGKKNSSSATVGYAAQPVFSETGLYQTATFELTITCGAQGADIRYTTDGSKPTTSSTLYSGPIAVSKNTVVRAAAFAPGVLPSEITTFTYLFVEEHTLPVVCVNGDPENIRQVFAAKDRQSKVEREVYIQYYEANGKLGVQFPCGIKGKGAGTLTFQQKSLAIHLRAGYGQKSVTYPFFSDSDLHTFSSLVLRNSGQDIGDHVTDARIRDSFCSRAVMGMNIDYALTRPVIMYLNGKYYGVYDFNEDQNKDYLVNHYGVDGDAVDIIRRNSTALQGTSADIKRVFNYAVNKNLADDAVFAEFAQWVDVAYFTDYLIAQTYFSNSDMFNQKYWRSQDYSVKWRPIYYDLDFSGANNYSRGILSQYFNENGVPSNDGSLTYMNIYIGLKKNAAWRKMCAERYVEVVCTYFKPERLLTILNALVEEMRPEMQRHIAHWGMPRSMSTWESALEKLRTFIQKRPDYALQEVRSYFNISASQMDEWILKYSG